MTDCSAPSIEILAAVIGLVGAVIGGAIATGGQLWMQSKTESLQKSYVVSNLVAALDQLAVDCADAGLDEGSFDGHPDEGGSRDPTEADPTFDFARNPENLKFIDASTSYLVLTIPHRILSINQQIMATAEWDDAPFYDETFEKRQELFCKLGLDVLSIAGEIRSKHGLPERPDELRNPEPEMKEQLSKINKRRSKTSLVNLDHLET